MMSKAIVITVSLVLLLGTLAHVAPAAFANPCSRSTNPQEKKNSNYDGKDGNNGEQRAQL